VVCSSGSASISFTEDFAIPLEVVALQKDMDRGRGRGLVSTPVLDSLLAVEDGSPNDGQLGLHRGYIAIYN
jgi:hypothetical protein